MVEYILGDFLVKTGKMTNAQLEEIVEKMDKVRVKLGLIAVEEGMMTMEQADEVNRLQSTMDKRFGDIAVEKGYLTDEQIGNLLKAQGNTYLAFAQVLVDAGVIKMEEIDCVLEDFRNKHSFSKTDMEMLKSDNPDTIVPLYLTPETLEFGEWISVVVRTMIRCIDKHVYIGKAEASKSISISKGAMQKLEGEAVKTSAFGDIEGGLLTIASVFGQADFTELDEDSLDAVGEFLNCVNGLYASALSQRRISLELMPPELVENGEECASEKVCWIPIYIKDKKLNFIIF